MLKSLILRRPTSGLFTTSGKRTQSILWSTITNRAGQSSGFISQYWKGAVRNASAPSAAYNQTVDAFPSIIIGPNGLISPQGPFAEAQAQVRILLYFY